MHRRVNNCVLLFLAFVLSACTTQVPASECSRVKFFNGVNVGIYRDRIIGSVATIEHLSMFEERLESLFIIPPDTASVISLAVYPMEEKYPIPAGCRLVANEHYLCLANLPDREVWISVQIEKQIVADDLVKTMGQVSEYVMADVLCDT